ncbi:RNA polymerase sigma factor RpoH [Insolitispirillum peregrinum]|uniref:RNA polymerase sigma factor n=1 Tax=Insolitispirillum peregrinum TaxID=80876 RepID=A0A1N7IIH3_9PROT|nr:RNA polymerase sigma factor RpoH [Insolitispirillum peregrinum]SIS36904.1 RNA polymerase, sigma 32 subunit, RpoH [Insolitispirillum peregrinum]
MAKINVSVPSVAAEGGLSQYMEAIKRYPLLQPSEELELAFQYRDHGSEAAGVRLITSHLRLVAKIAMGYRYYGLPVADLISEGNLGLLRAVQKFEPEKGFRLATYAMWWIKASINEYVLNSWSLVKVGTVAAQKKLFFNLRKMKARLGVYEDSELTPEQATWIATELSVPVEEVHAMNRRLSRQDASLDVPVSEDGELSRMDMLVDDRASQEDELASKQERHLGSQLLKDALETLNDRERHILTERRLRSAPITLEDLGKEYGISRERVRQIENRAFEKLQTAVRKAAAALESPGRRAIGALRSLSSSMS